MPSTEEIKLHSGICEKANGVLSNANVVKNKPISIERPPGMNGIIACNSYKNRHGTWHMKESGAALIGPYSSSYGSLESRGYVDRA